MRYIKRPRNKQYWQELRNKLRLTKEKQDRDMENKENFKPTVIVRKKEESTNG